MIIFCFVARFIEYRFTLIRSRSDGSVLFASVFNLCGQPADFIAGGLLEQARDKGVDEGSAAGADQANGETERDAKVLKIALVDGTGMFKEYTLDGVGDGVS